MSYWYRYNVTIGEFQDKVYIKVYKIKDLLDDKNDEFKLNNKFGTWRELFGPVLTGISTKKWNFKSKNYIARWFAGMICRTFFEVLVEDLIENKITYRLPYRFFAKLSVRETPKINLKDLKLYTTSLTVMMHKGARKRTRGILYHAKFTDRWRRILENKVENRERYSKIETDGKRK